MSQDVVLIHGASEVGEHMAELRRHFEQRGRTVYTPTLRHHDESMPDQAKLVAGVSLRDYVTDLTELTRNLNAPLIGGFSLGGLIAQLVAARIPHRGLFCAASQLQEQLLGGGPGKRLSGEGIVSAFGAVGVVVGGSRQLSKS